MRKSCCAILLVTLSSIPIASGFVTIQKSLLLHAKQPRVQHRVHYGNGMIFCSISSKDDDSQERVLVALQIGGLSLRERRRIALGVLPIEALPEERLGLAAVLVVAVCLSSAGLASGALLPAEYSSPWEVPLFGFFVVSLCFLLQIALSPSCLNGQAAFGQALRDTGWHAHALAQRLISRLIPQLANLVNQPYARRSRAQLARLLDVARRRIHAMFQLGRLRFVAWATRCGLAARWRQSLEWWSTTPPAVELSRLRSHLEWNWRRFVAETEARETREWMAEQLSELVERRKRAEGEER